MASRNRNKRPRAVRPKSEKRISKSAVIALRMLYPEAANRSLPVWRGECEYEDDETTLRPCPYVTCRHHLYADVLGSGALKFNFPDIDAASMSELPETCTLDVASRGPQTLSRIGTLMNMTRQGAREAVRSALNSLTTEQQEVLFEYAKHVHGGYAAD